MTFLGAGPSFSVCGGGRLGSVANGGGRGEEGRDSFQPVFNRTEQNRTERLHLSHPITAGCIYSAEKKEMIEMK